jgi:ribosomal protein S20
MQLKPPINLGKRSRLKEVVAKFKDSLKAGRKDNKFSHLRAASRQSLMHGVSKNVQCAAPDNQRPNMKFSN